MSTPENNEAGDHRSAASVRSLEVVTAAILFALGAVVIADSLRIGAGWNIWPPVGLFPILYRHLSVPLQSDQFLACNP